MKHKDPINIRDSRSLLQTDSVYSPLFVLTQRDIPVSDMI